MFMLLRKLSVLLCLSILMVFAIAIGQSSDVIVIDLDQGQENIRILGDDPGDYSGVSVSSGDVNGDGYDDVIIGAYGAFPAGGSYAGATYVIFGSSSPSATIDLNSLSADMTIYGDDAGDWSGYSVASGDINGDGYYDVIIGAPCADPSGGNSAGETYVIFGSNSPPSTIDLNSVSADITIYGDDANDLSGYSVSSGDISGDGYDDVIIGAHYADPAGGSLAGETYVIFGSSSPSATIDLNSASADMTIYGDDADDWSGYAVSSGDVNGDGYDDVIIGAPGSSPSGGSSAGETYVIFGSDSPPATIDLNSVSADMTIYGDDGGDGSGLAVSNGDINSDGYDDVIIGAPFADAAGGSRAGETYVIFGSDSPPATIDLNSVSADMTIYGDDAGDWSGSAVSSGDINGDGYDDVVIGAYGADQAGGTEAGESYVIFGSSSPPATIDLNSVSADMTIYGDDAGDESGWSVSSGDINGDGYDDVIISAYEADPAGGSNAGETYVILFPIDIVAGQGPGAASCVRDLSAFNGILLNTWQAFGAGNANGEISVAKGDVTGDGVAEFVIGQRSLGASSYVGVFAMNGTLLWMFRAFAAANTNGMVNVAVGDVDVDGVGEIVVGQGPGGQSYVRIFEYGNSTAVTTWKAFGSSNTNGEVNVAAGQTAGSGFPVGQIITGHGHGGQSYVRVWDYANPPILFHSFRAFGGGNTSGGIDVGVGNFYNDPSGRDFIVVGQGGPGATAAGPAGSYIRIFSERGALFLTHKAFGAANTKGRVTVSGGQADGDVVDEIIVGQAVGGNSYWRVLDFDDNLNLTILLTVKAFGAGNPSGQVDVAGCKIFSSGTSTSTGKPKRRY